MNRLLLAALLALPLGVLAQTSAVPTRISYHGKVVDSGGVLVGNPTPVNRVVTFRIWDSPSSPNAASRLYSEQQTVTISGGEFSVLIGAGTAVTGETNTGALDTIFDGNARYLGVTIDDPALAVDPEISPRQQLVSNPFSFRAKVAEGVASQAVTNAMIANNAVDTAQVADAAVTLNKIAAAAVDTTKLADNAVNAGKLANGAVTASKFAADIGVWSANGGNVYRSAGRVGIGTSSPGFDLDVFDASATPSARIGLHTTATGTTSQDGFYLGLSATQGTLWMNEALPLNIGTSDNSRLRIEPDGRMSFNSTNNDTGVSYRLRGVSGTPLILKVEEFAGADLMAIRNDGSIKIGEAAVASSTTAALQAVHATHARAMFQLTANGTTPTDGVAVGATASSSYLWDYEARALDLATNGTARMKISATGKFSFNTGTGTDSDYLFRQIDNVSGSILRIQNADGDNLFTFSANGNAQKPGGGSWSSSSDRRLKQDISDISGSLDKLLQLRAVHFRYKDEKRYAKGEQSGFIAQEMEKVFPQWVSNDSDGFRTITFSGFEAHAVQALRELRAEKDAEIAALKAQVQELKAQSKAADNRFTALERRINSLSLASARE